MKYCVNCLETNTVPHTKFNKKGLCLACSKHLVNKKSYNEKERLNVLKQIIEKFVKNKKRKSKFDCLIGVSGGKDSTRPALWVRDKLKLKPLLVCGAYPPEQIPELGAKNLSNLIELGFDLIVDAPAPQYWKKVLKKGFLNGNYLRAPELLLHSSQVRTAIKYGINLIFFGENAATNWNETRTKLKRDYDGNALRYVNTIQNCDLDWMKEFVTDKTKLIPYTYPSNKEFKKHNIQIIYLDWFSNNWSMVNNAKFACLNGMDARQEHVSDTGDLYGVMALDDNWVGLNQMIKYYKFGYGRSTDYLNFEIRSGAIKREDAIKLVEKYDGACNDQYIESFCKYIDISVEKFWDTVSNFVNKDLFTINNKPHGKKFFPKFKVGSGLV